MKRKIFSKLLMVALVIAAVGSFVSCKDYDDDINNLQNQINKAALQSELAALQQTVANNATAAKAAADAAEAAAKKYADELAAKSTAKAADLEKLIAEVKAIADAAATQKALDEVKAIADAAATKDELSAVKAIADAAATQAALTEAIADLNGAIEKVKAVADAAATKDELDAAKKELTEAIGKVETAAAAAKKLAEDAQAAADKAQETADKANTDLAAEVKRAKEAEEKLDAAIKKALEDAKKYTDDALTASKKYTDDEVAAAAAKAADDLAKAIANVYTKAEVDKLIGDAKTAASADAATKLAKALGDLGTASVKDYVNTEIGDAVADLKEELADTYLTQADFEKITGISGSIGASIDALYKAVTSVELVESYTGGAQGLSLIDSVFINLNIMTGKIGETSIFGDNEAICNKVIWATAEEQKNFTKDEAIEFESGVIVRVNPVTADITTAKILLVNSKGEALDDYVKVGTPVKYDKLITATRATSLNEGSGLWKIPFTLVAGKTVDDIKLAANTNAVIDPVDGTIKYKVGNQTYAKAEGNANAILYAIAINNTDQEDQADRFAVSSYDIAADANEYVPAFTFGFKVGSTTVENLKNRWVPGASTTEGKAIAEQKEYTATETTKAGIEELIWRAPRTADNANGALATPATAIVGDYTKGDAQDKTANAQITTTVPTDVQIQDARNGKDLYPVEVGEKITISGIQGFRYQDGEDDAITTENYYCNADGVYETTLSRLAAIKYYYVVLDAPRAIESSPSEINAWNSYDISGLNTVTDASESLDIVINDEKAKGDVIGFRVFAVNYDGTLADPDGRAFYVVVGDPAATATITVPYIATYAGPSNTYSATPTAAQVKAAEKNISFEEFFEIGDNEFTTDNIDNATKKSAGKTVIEKSKYPTILKQDLTINWALFKDAEGNEDATCLSEAKYIKLAVDNPQNMVDNQIVKFTLEEKTDVDHGKTLLNKLTINVKKLIPTANNTKIQWRSTLEPVDSKTGKGDSLTVYPLAAQSDNAATSTLAAVKWPKLSNRAQTWNVATANIKYASVDLAGYANELKKDEAYWVVSNVLQDGEAKEVTVKGSVGDEELATEDAFDNYVLKMDKEMVGKVVPAEIKVIYKDVSLESINAQLKDVPFSAWTGRIKFADGVEQLLKLEATSYIQNYKNATKTQDDKTPAKSNAYYYFWKDGVTSANAPLWGYITTAGYTLDTDLMKWIDGNATWNANDKTVAYATAPAAFVNATKVYEYEKIFTPVWGVRTNAADLKRQVLAEYVGLYDVSNNKFPGEAKLSTYLKFDVPVLSETAPAAKAETTLIEAENALTGTDVTGFKLKNKTGNVPTADVTCKLKIQGTDVFGYTVDDDNLSMSFVIKPLKKTDY